jgi:hypothetical protein
VIVVHDPFRRHIAFEVAGAKHLVGVRVARRRRHAQLPEVAGGVGGVDEGRVGDGIFRGDEGSGARGGGDHWVGWEGCFEAGVVRCSRRRRVSQQVYI